MRHLLSIGKLRHIAVILIPFMIQAAPAFSLDLHLRSYGSVQQYSSGTGPGYCAGYPGVSGAGPEPYVYDWWWGNPPYDLCFCHRELSDENGNVTFFVGYGVLNIYRNYETNYNVSDGGICIIQHNGAGTPVTWHWVPVQPLGGGGMTDVLGDGRTMKPGGDSAGTTEPINTISGNLYLDEMDVVIPCPGLPLSSVREYGSIGRSNSYAGNMWSHSYDWFLFDTNAVVGGQTNSYKAVKTGSGEIYKFLVTNGVYQAPADNNWRLEFTNQTYRLGLGKGVACEFDSNGVLQVMADAWSNTVTLTYTNAYPDHHLIKAQHGNGQYLSFTYTNDRLSRIDSPATNFYVTFSYNGSGCLTGAVRYAGGEAYVCKYAYDTWLTQRVNAAGDVFSYGYTNDGSGRGTELSVGSNYYHHALDYSTTGKTYVTYYRGSSNQFYRYIYDSDKRRLDEVLGPAESSNSPAQGLKYRYDTDGNITNEVVMNSDWTAWYVTASMFDAYHNPTNVGFGYCTFPSNTFSYSWDTNWLVMTSVTDPEGHKTEFIYTNGLLSSAKLFYDASNSYDTIYSYTTNGLLAGITNANGHWVQFGHDTYGNLNQITPQAGPTVNYVNNILGFTTNITMPGDSENRVTSMEVNELGWIGRMDYPDGLYETMSFDAIGNVTNHVDTAGRTTSYTYLPTKKLSSVTRQLGNTNVTTSVSYDSQFNTLNITDAKNRAVETYVLDIQDRPVAITNLEGQTMTINYGVGDYVKSIIRYDGTSISNSYNSDGLLSSTAFQSSTNAFSYLKNGLLRTASNETCIVSNSWSFANRLTSSVFQVSGLSVQPSVSYSYFPAGQVSNVISIAGTNTYSLDDADRVSSFTASLASFAPLVFNSSYNSNNGLLSQMTCTNTGVFVQYGYDVMDRVTNIVWKAASSNVLRSFTYQYNNASMITNIALEDGSNLGYSYDDLDRLTGETRSGNQQYAISYGWDEVGNRLAKTNGDASVSYVYSNGCNRLTGWTATSTNNFADASRVAIAGFSTEQIGTNSNLGQLYVTNSAGGTAATPSVSGSNFSASSFTLVPGTNQLIAAIGDAAGNVGYATNQVVMHVVTNATYLHNTAGCVTNLQYQSSSIGLTWSSQYQLTAVSTNGVECERNGYDALGRRVWSWDPSTGSGQVGTNFFVYDGVQIIADLNSTGGLARSYVWGPGIDNLLAMTVYTGTTVKTYFALTDHQGTVHAMADETGMIVESYRFDAWGRVLGIYDGSNQPISESSLGCRYLWQGREYSWTSGLYFFRTRFYDPITGRWLSNDPIGISGGLDQYVFCADNPVNSLDPFGLTNDPGDFGWPNFNVPAGLSCPQLGLFAYSRADLAQIEERTYQRLNNPPMANLTNPNDLQKVFDTEFLPRKIVNLDGTCYYGGDVNYFAQGMYDSRFNNIPYWRMFAWKAWMYDEFPRSDAVMWYRHGREIYTKIKRKPKCPE